MNHEGFPKDHEDGEHEQTSRTDRMHRLGENVVEKAYVSPTTSVEEIDAIQATQGSSGGTRDGNGGQTIP